MPFGRMAALAGSSGKQVRKFKEAYPDLPKNDYVDAFVIADHLRFGRINRRSTWTITATKPCKPSPELV